MIDEDSKLLQRIAQQLEDDRKDHLRMHLDNIERFAEDREERRKWREDIDVRFAGIEKRLAPVVFLHQFVVKGGTWAVAAVGAVKGWFFIKDHLK